MTDYETLSIVMSTLTLMITFGMLVAVLSKKK